MAADPCRIYRAYLVDDALSEIPIAELTCKRRKGASTWVVIRSPNTSAPLRTLCTQHIGRDIAIYAGVMVAGTEVLGQYLRALLTEVESDWDPHSGSLTLTGRVRNPSYSAASRTLAGVQSRGADNDRHTAIGAVDPALRPGDTLDDGADTWIVGAVDVRIGPGLSQMQVREDG
jgi:hypothetical protein